MRQSKSPRCEWISCRAFFPAMILLSLGFLQLVGSPFLKVTQNKPPPEQHTGTIVSRVDVLQKSSSMCDREIDYLPKRPGRILLLASFPGSGNTWVRHVLQQSTRIHTGSMYYDRTILKQFPAEGTRDSSVLCVKTHFPCAGCWNKKRKVNGAVKPIPLAQSGDLKIADAVIYIARNPFDALVAEFTRKMSGANHTGVLHPAAFQKSIWQSFVSKESTNTWVQNVEFYMRHSVKGNLWKDARGRNVFVVFYEKLKTDYVETLRALLKYLFSYHSLYKRFNVTNVEEALSCSLQDQIGSFKRTTKGRINPFTEAQISQVCEKAKDVWQKHIWGPCDGKLFWEKHSGPETRIGSS